MEDLTVLAERLLTKRAITPEGCWVTTSGTKTYTLVNDGGRMRSAHRIMYQVTNGPIPDGMNVCHHCDNPPCWNPDHLFAGTDRDNQVDMVRKGRHFLHGRKLCRQGLHRRIPENLYTDKRGIAWCRECMRMRQRRKRARQREANQTFSGAR